MTKNFNRYFSSGAGIGLGAICFLAGLNWFAIEAPKTAPAILRFKFLYSRAINKGEFLREYNSELMHHGGHLPAEVDQLLCTQLQHPDDTAEFSHIVHFYISKTGIRGGSREGKSIFRLPDTIKERITGLIVSEFNAYDHPKLEQALTFVEELRRGETLWKSHLDQSNRSYDKRDFAQARRLFIRWHQRYPTWADKQKHAPMQGTPFSIESI